TTYIYDNLNRVLSRTPDATTNEPAVSFTYTATGKRQTMTDASGTTTYAYDSMDRLTQKATPEGTLKLHLRRGRALGFDELIAHQRRLDQLHLRPAESAEHGGGRSPHRQPDD